MKKIVAALVLVILTSCTSKTEFGPCIGVFDEPDPKLLYKISGWNVAMGVVFFELVIPPIVVIVDETKCPYAQKTEAK